MKVQKNSKFQHHLAFNFLDINFDVFYHRFLESDLGKIYRAIVWDKMIKAIGLKSHRKGLDSIFSHRGKMALMFLKHYAGVSDRKLIEQLNSNIEYQFFCDIYLGNQRIENYKIVSQIRTELFSKILIEKIQKVLYEYWSEYIKNPLQTINQLIIVRNNLKKV